MTNGINLYPRVVLPIVSSNNQYSSAASIKPITLNVFAVDDHVITCVLDDIPGQITGVLWTPAVETENEYSLDDGTFSGNKQESTLTITAAKLTSLHSSSATQTFTCKITIGANDTEVTATRTITIFNPSKKI